MATEIENPTIFNNSGIVDPDTISSSIDVTMQTHEDPDDTQDVLIWDSKKSQHAYLNIAGSLYGFEKSLSISDKDWEPPSTLSPQLNNWYSECRIPLANVIIELLLAENCSDTDSTGKPYITKMLIIAVGNKPEPIIESTLTWPKFKLDESALRDSLSEPNSLAAAIRWFTKFPNWIQLLSLFEKRESTYENSNLIKLNYDRDSSITICHDEFGFPVGSYDILSDNLVFTVRITDISYSVSDTDYTYDQIVYAHRKNMSWEHDGTYDSFMFNSFKINTDTSMSSIIGTTNKSWNIAAVQAGGIVQINATTPLNVDVCSVSTIVWRSLHRDPPLSGKYLDFSHQDQKHFTNMIEIYCAAKTQPSQKILLYSGIFDETTAINSNF